MENTSFYQKYFFLLVITIIVLFSRWQISLPEDVSSYPETASINTQNNSNLASRAFTFPLVFEENIGQYSGMNRYISRASVTTLVLLLTM